MALTQPYNSGCSVVFLLNFIGENKFKILIKVKILSCQILHTKNHFFTIFQAPHYIAGLGILKLLKLQTLSVNLFAFFFIIFESAIYVLHVYNIPPTSNPC